MVNTKDPTSTSTSTSTELEVAFVSGETMLVDTLEGAGLQAQLVLCRQDGLCLRAHCLLHRVSDLLKTKGNFLVAMELLSLSSGFVYLSWGREE